MRLKWNYRQGNAPQGQKDRINLSSKEFKNFFFFLVIIIDTLGSFFERIWKAFTEDCSITGPWYCSALEKINSDGTKARPIDTRRERIWCFGFSAFEFQCQGFDYIIFVGLFTKKKSSNPNFNRRINNYNLYLYVLLFLNTYNDCKKIVVFFGTLYKNLWKNFLKIVIKSHF